MNKRTRAWIAIAALCFAPAAASAAETDRNGCTDHPAFPKRMSGYFITDCETRDFDSFKFETKNPREKTSVEGRWTKITYRMFTGSQQPSALAVVRNYENAIKAAGGTVLFVNENRWVNGKLAKDGKEIWAQAEKGNGMIWLHIVEKGGMTQEVVADAAAFGNDLKATGHAAVYGIYFDSGKSEVKPESEAALKEVVKLLAGEPALKLLVVGHTDSVGQLEANMKLSQARAEAVVQALVKGHGAAAARLKAQGAGPIAPVTTNRTEEGRAKNRRVELVEQ